MYARLVTRYLKYVAKRGTISMPFAFRPGLTPSGEGAKGADLADQIDL